MNLERLLEEPGTLLDIDLFTIAGTQITVATVIIFGLIILASFLISWIVQRAAGRALKRSSFRDMGAAASMMRLMHYAILLVGFAIALNTIGINLTALFTAGAIFAVGLGFAMQNIAQNFVSGIIMLIERSITPGDILQIDDRIVRVEELGIRSTIVRSLDDEDLIVPNSTLIQTTVVNYTLRDRDCRIRTVVGVAYDSDLKLVKTTLEQAAANMDSRRFDREPRVLLLEFGDNSVIFEVSIWITDPWDMMRAKSELNEVLWWALKEAEITIAFPQLDLHLDGPALETLRGRPNTA